MLGVDADAGQVDEMMASLVAKSLLTVVRTTSGARFHQLETLRQFGEERLEHRKLALEVHRRHLDHFVVLARRANEGASGPDEVRWHHTYRDEWHNLRNALRWACAIGDCDAALELLANVVTWASWRMEMEVAEWIDLALAMPTAQDHHLRPRLLAAAALVASMRGNSREANERFDHAVAEETRLDLCDPWMPVFGGALRDASQGYELQIDDATEAQRRAGDAFPYVRHVALAQEAMVRALVVTTRPSTTAQWQATVDRIRDIVAEEEAFGNPSALSHALTALGLALTRSDPATAVTMIERALELAVATDAEFSTAQTRSHLAAAYIATGRCRDALAMLAPAIQRHVRAGSEGFGWFMVVTSIDVLAAAGAIDVAAQLMQALKQRNHPAELLHRHEVLLAQAAMDAGRPATPSQERRVTTLSDAAALIQDALDSLTPAPS